MLYKITFSLESGGNCNQTIQRRITTHAGGRWLDSPENATFQIEGTLTHVEFAERTNKAIKTILDVINTTGLRHGTKLSSLELKVTP
ncbi:MAG: hypothetical protein H6595_04605 [Flavobacteriales bacterium]|nr:hypothetical protein [Flavobacteriales bacterium]MCB9166741.1 hypothetical protein [Flavobacteriales bacterium]